ncbi:hypothetical protein FPRO04_14387 [Fusarium proliferatum]|uniref:Azaphilone pigments biosynthesis cluster protein L N-terminal domain-containing protein n=3 Tax=Fusarium oxysporum TaxID=5507 RepID=A0A420PAG4_FUSOX|nr:hypothetical protein FPRO04_14387 [Fusarium proliferatum]RKK06605.1 hypothetical protein BFJ65_g18503 [Fusarium oxysporum f. sp. cepae]RKK89512.1 hypothetical protein BFJ68_g16691 [Fusarium oxysporum]
MVYGTTRKQPRSNQLEKVAGFGHLEQQVLNAVKMADGLSVASSVVALVAFAFKTSTTLYTTIRGFQSQDKNARALKNELADVRGVLQSLAETVDNNGDLDFGALKLPLLRCGKTCEEYGDLIARCTKHSSSSRPGLRDWISQQYLKGDITDIREMLAGYKSTINIALASANMRVITSITPEALEEYKDMIRDTTNDLQGHMKRLEERVNALAASEAESLVQDQDEPEWMAMLEEKQSTQEGLKICSQLSAQIEQLESTSKEHTQFSQQPSAHKFIRSGLGVAKGSIQSLVSRLQTHEHDIDNRMEAMMSAVPLSEQEATQLAQLQETKESLRQCMRVVADAGEALSNERCNVFEDITMADSSYGISVSTVKDLVVARRLNLSGQARYLGGQISDESYQRTIDGLTQLDLESAKSGGQGIGQTPSAHGFERYGRGFNLPSKQ